MSKGLDKLKSGDFNNMDQEKQPDGSVVITLSKRGVKKAYKFRVKNLYKSDEEELNVNTGKPIAKGNLPEALS